MITGEDYKRPELHVLDLFLLALIGDRPLGICGVLTAPAAAVRKSLSATRIEEN
jgi:hypothetical protein